MLGDGSLRIPNIHCVNARFAEAHSSKQETYLDWKMEKLARFNPRKIGPLFQTSGFSDKKYQTYHLYTSSSPELTEYYNKYYPAGVKILADSLELLEPLGLSIWFCDDGCLRQGTHETELATENYSFAENTLIRNWFCDYGINCKLEPRGNDRVRIAFSANGRDALFQIITPFVPDCMKYKVDLDSPGHRVSLVRINEGRAKRNEQGLCFRCGQPLDTELTQCSACREKFNAVQRRYKERKRARGS